MRRKDHPTSNLVNNGMPRLLSAGLLRLEDEGDFFFERGIVF